MTKDANDGATKKATDGDTIKKESFSWNEKMDAAFIQALLNEQSAGNRPNGTFASHAYNNIVKALSEKFNITFEKEKLKNRVNTLKKYFNLFHDVFKGVSLSGYAWNSSTRLIEADDDVWEELKKVKPDVYELKTKPINCYDEMYALWAKDRATGSCSFTAKEKKNRQNNDHQAYTIEDIDYLCENNVINLDNIDTTDDIPVTSPTPQSDGKLPTKSRSKKRKVVEEDPSEDKIANSLDNIVHALDRNSKVLENSRPHVYTEGELYKELKGMGLGRKDVETAYAYLLDNPVKTRGLFGCPVEERCDYLKAIMGLGDSEDSDTRG